MHYQSQMNKFEKSAICMKKIGDSKLPFGLTVRELISIDGISLWEVVEPTLAAFEFPRVIDTADNVLRRLSYYARSRVVGYKYRYLNRRDFNQFKYDESQGRTSDVETIFLGFSGYMERDVVWPLAAYFKSQDAPATILFDNRSRSTLEVKNVCLERVNINQLWNEACELRLQEVLTYYRKIRRTFSRGSINSIYKSCQPGVPFRLFSSFIHYVLYCLIPYYLHYLVVANRLLMTSKVKLIFSPDVSDPRTRIFGMVGQKNRARWLDIQFGIYAESAVEWMFCKSDVICAWGPESCKLFEKYGVPPEKIRLTGSPKFDSYYCNSKISLPEGSRTKKLKVLFCSLYELKAYSNILSYVQTMRSVKRDIVRISIERPDIELWIKLHPIEDPAFFRKEAERFPMIKILGGESDIRESIKECDVFVTLGSTSTMDAILLEKPVIYPNYPGLVWWDDIYLNSDVVIQAPCAEDLRSIFNDLKSVINSSRSRSSASARQKFISSQIKLDEVESSKLIYQIAQELLVSDR